MVPEDAAGGALKLRVEFPRVTGTDAQE